MSEQRRGALLGAAAYLMWGLFPLYFPLLAPAGAVEILAHRMVWSLVVMLALVALLGRLRQVGALVRNPRTLGLLALAAVAITVNWTGYIWGVNNGHVVETSLGYFINPLVTMLMGVLVLGERLRPVQWSALGVAAIAVAVLTWDLGRLPWLALTLALAFATYGLFKKKANAGAFESLAVETGIVAPFALAYLVWLSATGVGTFATEGAGHSVLLVTTGLATAVPLICFGAAATRIPMVTIGLLQYIAPILQFGFGVFYWHEEMPPGRWAGFVVVWVALAMFTYDAVIHRRSQLRAAAEAAAV